MAGIDLKAIYIYTLTETHGPLLWPIGLLDAVHLISFHYYYSAIKSSSHAPLPNISKIGIPQVACRLMASEKENERQRERER